MAAPTGASSASCTGGVSGGTPLFAWLAEGAADMGAGQGCVLEQAAQRSKPWHSAASLDTAQYSSTSSTAQHFRAQRSEFSSATAAA